YIFHGDEGHAVPVARLIDGHDVRVLQRRGGTGFALEAGNLIRAARQTAQQHLERHFPAEGGISGEIDRTHGAPADEGLDLVGSEGLPDEGGLGGRRVYHGWVSFLARATVYSGSGLP